MLNAALAQQAQLEGITKMMATDAFFLASASIYSAAQQQDEITSDDVWGRLEADGIATFLHPNAMGAAFKVAAQKGLIKATGRVIPSTRVSSHGRLVQIWKSLVLRGESTTPHDKSTCKLCLYWNGRVEGASAAVRSFGGRS